MRPARRKSQSEGLDFSHHSPLDFPSNRDLAIDSASLDTSRAEALQSNGRSAKHYEDLPLVASDLVHSRPDIIVTKTTPAARAAEAATNTIPIVFTGVGDAVATGLVRSLSRPGANATGVSTLRTHLQAA